MGWNIHLMNINNDVYKKFIEPKFSHEKQKWCLVQT
jgi:hypothetical protein